MADCSEWLEATTGTGALDDDAELDGLERTAVGRWEYDALLCLIDCQHGMFRTTNTEGGGNGTMSANLNTTGDTTKVVGGPAVNTESTGSGGTGHTMGYKSSTPFRDAARCVFKLYQDKVITRGKDIAALVLYNTRGTSNIYDLPGQYVFHHFAFLEINSVQKLEELAAAGIVPSKEHERFNDTVGHAQDSECRLSDVLWVSQHMFLSQKFETIKSRRIFLFTNDDVPHRNDESEKERCLSRIQDLYEMGVTLEVFPVGEGCNTHVAEAQADSFDTSVHPGGTFRGEKFWEPLQCKVASILGTTVWEDAVAVHTSSGPQTFNDLMRAVHRRAHPQRSHQNTLLTIAPGVGGACVPTMAVSVYYPLMSAVPPRVVWLDPHTNEIVRRQVQLVEKGRKLKQEENESKESEVLDSSTLLQSIAVGGRRLFFTPHEKKRIVATAVAGALVGFSICCFKRASDTLQHKHAIRKSSFLCPNPRDGGEGSLRMFVLLTQVMQKEGKVAVAQHIARSGAVPRLVALVPAPLPSSVPTRSLPVEGLGLYVVPLPYAEDIRGVPSLTCFGASTTPTPEELDMAARIVSALSGSYDIDAVPNPSLQLHYNTLRRLALRRTHAAKMEEQEQEQVENVTSGLRTLKDFSLPDREGMSCYAQLFREFNEMILGSSYDADSMCAQPNPKGTVGVKMHRTKKSTEDISCGGRDDDGGEEIVHLVEAAFVQNTLPMLTVAQLKAYLGVTGGSIGGARRKDELIKVVTRVLQSRRVGP